MKKLMLIGLVLFSISCQNPEDKATGNPDSTNFNNGEKNLNTGSFPGDETNSTDSSSSPGTSKENTNSTTSGTNRGYGADSGKKQ